MLDDDDNQEPKYWIFGNEIYAASQYVQIDEDEILAVGFCADEETRQFNGLLFVIFEKGGVVDAVYRYSVDVVERLISMLNVALDEVEEHAP